MWDPIRVGWGDPTVPGAGYAMIYSGKAVSLCGASSVAEVRAENPPDVSLWVGLSQILTEEKAFGQFELLTKMTSFSPPWVISWRTYWARAAPQPP